MRHYSGMCNSWIGNLEDNRCALNFRPSKAFNQIYLYTWTTKIIIIKKDKRLLKDTGGWDGSSRLLEHLS